MKAIAVALALNLLLAVAVLRPAPALVIHPLAPALTRIEALGDRPLAPPARRPAQLLPLLDATVRSGPTAGQLQRVTAVRRRHAHIGERAREADRLRHALLADAEAMAQVLGPERLGALLAARSVLQARSGEVRAWREAAAAAAR